MYSLYDHIVQKFLCTTTINTITTTISNETRRERLPKECYISHSFHSRRRCSTHGEARNKTENSVYRGEWAYRMRSEAFKDKARLQLHSKNFGLKQVLFVKY